MREQRMSMLNPLARDLDHVLAQTEELWKELRGERIFITGGTGFFGCWLLESFTWANQRLGLDAAAVVLTRNPDAFREKAPHLADDFAIQLQSGDIRSFHFPEGEFPIVIHAATERYFEPTPSQPLSVFDRDIEATRRVLEFARSHRTRRFLLTSSGAVYGKQPPDLTHLPEDYTGAPATTGAATAYGQSKRASEFMCSMYARQYGFHAAIARCFAFVGPYLPLDANYAIGNFIRDALAGNPIVVKGDGTPFRSYLYAADLAIWLWTILMQGESCRPYNVGSEQAVSIAQLASTVSTVLETRAAIQIRRESDPGSPPERYVPDTTRARYELGLTENVPLTAAIQRTSEELVARGNKIISLKRAGDGQGAPSDSAATNRARCSIDGARKGDVEASGVFYF